MSAVYWLSISPENMPAPFVRKAGSPTLSAGLFRRFILRSDMTLTIVTAALIISIGRLTGLPWKFAPEMVRFFSAKKIGLSPTPLSSISTCERAHATASCAAPITCGVDRIE